MERMRMRNLPGGGDSHNFVGLTTLRPARYKAGHQMLFAAPSPSAYLERLQRKHPPAVDHVVQIYAASRGRLPASLTDLVSSKRIVVGTVGRAEPDAYATPVGGGAAVVFHQGMMDVVYAITRSLVGEFVGTAAAGVEYQRAVGSGSAASLAADVLRLAPVRRSPLPWLRGDVAVTYPEFRLKPQARSFAETLATAVEQFMLCYQLARAVRALTSQDVTDEE